MKSALHANRALARHTSTAFTSVIALLDDGMRCYRRGFVPLISLTIGGVLPIVALISIAIGFEQWWLLFVLILVFIPLVIALNIMLSRAALLLATDQPLTWKAIGAISPARLVTTGCYSVVVFLIANILASALLTPLSYLSGGALFGVIAAATGAGNAGGALGEATGFLITVVFILAIIFFSAISLVAGMASYACMIYSTQPLIHTSHQAPTIGRAVEDSIGLMLFQPVRTVFAFTLVGAVCLIFAAASLTAISSLASIPLVWVFGSESPLAVALLTLTWVTGTLLSIPMIPVCMALLYQQQYTAWHGDDLAARLLAAGKHMKGQEA